MSEPLTGRQKFEYKNGFQPGDRVGPVYTKPGERHGTFVEYCRGYKSHCVVQYDGDDVPTRVKAVSLRLVERKLEV
jgi:hypothetical protein